MKVAATGFAWYQRDDYPRILEIMDDAAQLPRTFDEWLALAEGHERELRAKGVDVVRAVIKPDVFVGWCAVRGLKVDGSARGRFGSEAAGIAMNARDANTRTTAS